MHHQRESVQAHILLQDHIQRNKASMQIVKLITVRKSCSCHVSLDLSVQGPEFELLVFLKVTRDP